MYFENPKFTLRPDFCKHEKHIAGETYLESPQRYMMEFFCERANDFKPCTVFSKKNFIMFDIVLNTPLSYRKNIWYYNTGDSREFLAQRSKLTTKLTSKVTNKSFINVAHCFSRTSGEKNI